MRERHEDSFAPLISARSRRDVTRAAMDAFDCHDSEFARPRWSATVRVSPDRVEYQRYSDNSKLIDGAKGKGRESSYEHCFEVKSKSNLTCQFVRIKDTRIDEGIALNTLFIFNDDFYASG